MADEKQMKSAEAAYKLLCDMLDEDDWKFERSDDKLAVRFIVQGEDIPMEFVAAIDPDRYLIRIVSRLPFHFGEDARVAGAIVTGQVNFKLAEGCFDYDFSDGEVRFKLTSSYRDSLISKELFNYMIRLACYTVDMYNDTFMLVAKGMLSADEFIAKL